MERTLNPYFHSAGINIGVDQIKAVINNDNYHEEHLCNVVPCVNENIIFTNGIMYEFRKLLLPLRLSDSLFFELLRSFVSLPMFTILQSTVLKNFIKKNCTFEKKLKNEQKNKKTLPLCISINVS